MNPEMLARVMFWRLAEPRKPAVRAPYPRPAGRVPLLGDVFRLSPRSPMAAIQRLGASLGPIFEIKVFGQRLVVAADPSVVADLCDESRFAKYVGPELVQLRKVIGSGLVSADVDDPTWRNASELMQPAFSQQAMRAYHSTLADVAMEFAAYWLTKVDGPAVDVATELSRATNEMTGRVTFGQAFGSFERVDPHPFMAALTAMINQSERANIMRRVPLSKLLMRRAQEASDKRGSYINGVVDDVIRERRANPRDERNDILDVMLGASGPTNPDRISDEDIRYQVIGLIFGADATFCPPSIALYYLSQNPEIFERARAEVDRVWGPPGASPPSFEQVTKLRYVRRVLDEALRLWSPVQGFLRVARQDTLLADRYPLEKGEWVVVFIPLLHRDRVWGTDVDEFDPDRFLPERVKARPAHAFKPYGTGMRSCIGRHLAVHESLLLLGTILQRFDTVPQEGYRLEVQESGGVKPAGFELYIRRRHESSSVN